MQVIGHKTRSIFLDRYNIVNQSDLDVFRGRMEASPSHAERGAREFAGRGFVPVLSQSADSDAGKKPAKAFKLLKLMVPGVGLGLTPLSENTASYSFFVRAKSLEVQKRHTLGTNSAQETVAGVPVRSPLGPPAVLSPSSGMGA